MLIHFGDDKKGDDFTGSCKDVLSANDDIILREA